MAQANPLQIWQCCFKSRPLVQIPIRTQSLGSETCAHGNDKYRQTPRESDWLSVFLDHPFLVHHLSFTEIKSSDLSVSQTCNLATLVPDAVVNLKNIWQKEPEAYIGVLLCADVSGFTHLCEQFTAGGRGGTYHITAALNLVFGAMVELIYKSEGDVLKFSGDALLAVWKVGKDQYLFDVIHQVLSCGLLIQKTLIGYRTEANLSLKVKIAISAGMLHFAVIGSERARHYVVVGKPVEDIKDAGSRCISGDVLVAASAWDHCCPRNYDYTTKDGLFIKVDRVLYNPRGKRVYMTRVLYSLGQGSKNRNSVARRSSYSNIATPSSYSSESLSQRSSLPVKSESETSVESISTSSSSAESLVSEDSVEIAQSPSGSISDLGGTSITRDLSIGHSPSRLFMHGNMADIAIRPSVSEAARQMTGALFRPFMIPPVAQQVDADQPLEYLTEMRHVTTMFVNVVPEVEVTAIDLINLVDHIYSTVCRLVYSSMGVVNKVSLFDKDVMMLCIFGLRGFKHQQESQSALRCSSTVKRTLQKVRGVRYVSVGVTTGIAYCGVVGHPLRREYTVVGSPVNHAARLMVAYPGKVSCEQNTRRLSCLPVQLFRSLPQRSLKGIRQIGEVYEYHEDTRKCGPVLMAAAGPLLGRDDIIAEVEHQLEPRHRKYQVIMLMGEPRIGKSRLLTVMAKTFVAHTPPVVLQLQPMHSAVPFAAAHFVARQVLGLNIAERQARLRKLLPDVSREDLSTLNRKLAVNFPRFVESQPTDGTVPSRYRTGRRETALKLIARMVQALDPLTIFLLDDVHYADEFSSQIAFDVVRIWRNNPQLKRALGPLIIAAVTVSPIRPPPAINRLMANLSCVRFITLGPLPSDLLPALACQLLGVRSVEFELIRVLEENSRGNPGWCESYLSALLSSNGLRVDMMPLSEMRARTFCVPDTALLTFCQCDPHLPSTSTLSSVLTGKSGNGSVRRSEDDYDFAESSHDSLEEEQDDGSVGSDAASEEQGNVPRAKETRSDPSKRWRSAFLAWRTFWKGHLQASNEALPALHAAKSNTVVKEYCLRGRSGRCSACSMEDENTMQPVCLLAPHLDYNQEVAAHLNGAIVASFDLLPPMEQLLLKCGSVLGDVFHRSVLFQLLKGLRPVSKRRVVLAMQRLFEMCVLECSLPGPNIMSSELSCRCDVDERGTALNEEDTQILFTVRQESCPGEYLPSDQSNEIKEGNDGLVTTSASDNRSSTDSTRKSADSVSSDRRKSSFTNPVRFSVGLMGPTRSCSTGPTKPALRKATPIGQEEANPCSRPPRPSESSDTVQVVAQPSSDQPSTQDALTVAFSDEQPSVAPPDSQVLRSSTQSQTNEIPPSVVEILLPNEGASGIREEFISNSQDFLNVETVRGGSKKKPRKIKVKRVRCPLSMAFSDAMAFFKGRFCTQKEQDATVSLKYLLSCLPTAPCNNCECPMLLADIYRRLIEHCSAAGLKLQQLRFMMAYGALTMVAGYPIEAMFELTKAIEVAEKQNPDEKLRFDGGFDTVKKNRRDLYNIIAKINALMAEARLQIGDLAEARFLVHKETSRLPCRRPKASAHAHAISSDIYTIEGDWARAEREALKALKASGSVRRKPAKSQRLEDTIWALAAAIDAARQSGHLQRCEQLERALTVLVQLDTTPASTVLLPANRNSSIEESTNLLPSTGSDRTSQRRSVSKSSMANARQARAAARLLYSIFVSRLHRGYIEDVLEPGEAALSAAEAMGATFARAAILPDLALARILLLDITRGVALISYFRKLLGGEDSLVDGARSSISLKHPSLDWHSLHDTIASHKTTPPLMLLEEDLVLLSTAKYHCIRLDATLNIGAVLHDAQREAEQFIYSVLGSKSIISPSARRVAARLSLLNARKGKWAECALLATLAAPSLTILEPDPNSSITEIGQSAMCLLEAALYGRASVNNENTLPVMSKMFDNMSRWISALRQFVKRTPLLVPRFLFLSAYYKMLRGKSDDALEAIESAISIADQQGNRLARTYITLHKAIWQGKTSGLSTVEWLYTIDRNDKTSQEMPRSSISTVPLASIPSGESVVTTVESGVPSTTVPPPPTPTDTNSPTTVPTDQVETAVRAEPVLECATKSQSRRRSIRSSGPRYSGKEGLSSSTDDPAIRRWETQRHSTTPVFDDKYVQIPFQGTRAETVHTHDILNAIFFCLPIPKEGRK